MTQPLSDRRVNHGVRTVRYTGRSAFYGDRLFYAAVAACAAAPPALFGLMFLLLALDAHPALLRYGLAFLTTSTWDPVFERFGAAAYIYGTLVTSVLAVVLATPVAVGAALYVTHYAPAWLREATSFLVEMLAAIPSIIYGLWGFFVLAPLMRDGVEPLLQAALGPLPGLGELVRGPARGKDLLTGGVILAIMILPTIMAVSREVILAVPREQREGVLALGATKWEMICWAVLPYARPGIAGAAILGLARALGETMAVTMVIGNSSTAISPSLLTPGYTMASAIANQFTEADTPIYFSAIVGVALVLMLVTLLVNLAARALLWLLAHRTQIYYVV